MNRPRRSTHSFPKYLFPRARNPINSCQRERKKKKESSRDVVSSSQFLELIDSSSNTESSSRLSQTRVNRVNFKITKFPRQTLSQHFPLPQFTHSPFFPSEATDSNRSTFPSLLSLTLSYHCLVSSRDRIVANFLPTPPTSHLPDWESIVLPERFPSPSIFVSFRLIDLSLRIFVSPVRCRSPGREAGGGRRGLWARIDKRSTLFRFLSRFTR